MRAGPRFVFSLAIGIAAARTVCAQPLNTGSAAADGDGTAGAALSLEEKALTAQQTFRNRELTLPTEPQARFHALGDTARAAYEGGDDDRAQVLSRELLRLASHYRDDWHYGRAIATADIVLGRVALRCDHDRKLAEA